ncbi:MAG: hypothetical protein KDJ46_02920 [Rhodobiaceae bacterium]|nr:hypothetical protein [Rhodobiaceae bacterium]
MRDTLSQLKRRLAALEPAAPRPAAGRIALGCPALDTALGGGLLRGRLHEIFAASPAEASTAAGFIAALSSRAADGRHCFWVRQGFAETEAGALHAPGLAALGLDPDALILVRARDGLGVLRAALEALRCPALGAVIIEPWGEPKALDFTASRRLALAAARSGVTCFLLRLNARLRPSAAATRWRAAAAPSRPLSVNTSGAVNTYGAANTSGAANAPGAACFDIALLRQRAGMAGTSWRLEWDHALRVFNEAPPLSGAVAALPAGRPAADILPLARTG